ncbi:MAG: glycosyltransferase family 4 protein [Anaerolineae bacterium]|nr:glycosyltransferase family 4 protein [Anaerolineae bacterium]
MTALSPRRVLLISRCPPYPLHLGDRLIVWHLARQLAQRGHTLDLLAYTQQPDDAADVPQYASFFRQVTLLPEPARRTGDYLRRLLWPPARWPRQAAAAWSPAMWQAVQQQLDRQQYEVLHLFGGVQVYELYHALRGQPALITPYESYSLYLQRQVARTGGLRPWLNWQVAQQYERWMFAPYAQTVVLAQPDAAALQRLAPGLPVTIIPNGIDLEYFSGEAVPPDPDPDRDPDRDAPTLLFVGNYEYAPNVDCAHLLATEILPQVQRHLPQARLLLVGHAPPPSVLALQSAAVTVTGRVPDVRPWYAGATVFVCALRTGAGLKNKVLEALAMRLPVVATPLSVDGIAVEHGHSALIAPVAALAGEVVRLLQDAPLRQRLAEAGRRLIETRYSWSGVAAQYEALYARLAAADRRSQHGASF